MVAMALTMQVCIALQVSLSLSWPSFVSEMPAPADWKTGHKTITEGTFCHFYFIFSTAASATGFACNSGLPA